MTLIVAALALNNVSLSKDFVVVIRFDIVDLNLPGDKRDIKGNTPILPYALFVDEKYTDKDYHKQFPTIYHLRKWLMENGFQGQEGQEVPEMTEEYCQSVSERYIELYERIVGEKFERAEAQNIMVRIEDNIIKYLDK